MRIGLLGPAEGKKEELREAIEFLLGDVSVDQAIYLGKEEDTIGEVITEWAREIFDGEPGEEAFLEKAVQLAIDGSPDEIADLLGAESSLRHLGAIRKLPPPPARAVEMMGDRIILAVHDKSVLDEEDIANASLIVYGNGKEAELRRFGTRYFLTPGPVAAGRVAVLELEEDGNVAIAIWQTSGLPVLRERMARRTTKVSVVP